MTILREVCDLHLCFFLSSEVLCFTRGRNGVKVYDYITGKTVAILPAKEKQKLDGFVVRKELCSFSILTLYQAIKTFNPLPYN